jgi:general secretion pathway protein D
MLAGLILDNERRGLTGLPGVASIPFIGRLFAKNKDEAQQTDIVMTLTPHIIRRTQIDEHDLRSFLVGGEASPLVYETAPPAAPTTPPAPAPGRPRVEPIRPPSP